MVSLQVAECFGKERFHVMRDIEQILSQVPENFIESNFGFIEREAKVGFGTRKDKVYILSKGGFTMLTMGYTGEKAMKFKVYSSDGVHNQIGITEEGLQLIKKTFCSQSK